MLEKSSTPYTGRFAPTPSGPLHLGSLLTALASFLQARSQQGRWLIRMDDLDKVRCPAGVDQEILRQLQAHGLYWDDSPRYQSQHVEEYQSALAHLDAQGLIYRCTCTRAQISRKTSLAAETAIYPGTCRAQQRTAKRASIRLKSPAQTLTFTDANQGPQQCDLSRQIGDFVLRRADGVIAYQLACAIDEAAQQITEVVRGSDLIDSSFCQITLLKLLKLPLPQYRHLPVLTGSDARKLSKQNHAQALQDRDAGRNLLVCLRYLGQQPVAELENAPVPDIILWAIHHWNVLNIPKKMQLPLE